MVDGRRLKMMPLVEEYTRECLALWRWRDP
jgi:hypothetical protein